MKTAKAVPAWMRRIVVETELVPLEDLKNHTKTASSLLLRLLRQTDNPQELREALLRLWAHTDRVLRAMRWCRHKELPPLRSGELAPRLAKLAKRLPAELVGGSERRRARKLHETRELCQRMLLTLMLALLLGMCPLCQIWPVLCDHEKFPSTEFLVAP